MTRKRRISETFRLPTRPPFANEALVEFLGQRAIPGVERRDGSSLVRAFPGIEGAGTLVRVTPATDAVEVTVRGPAEPDRKRLQRAVIAALDLAVDGAAIDRALAADPALARAVRERPGLRVPGGWDGFELAVRAILGQQVSVAGARTLAGRIAERHGEPFAVDDERWFLFPDAERLRRAGVAGLSGIGLTTAKIAAILAVADAVASGELDLAPGADGARARARLLAIRGIGPWTVEYLAMRALHDPDAFPATDLVLKRRLESHGGAKRAERWRPWRAYAAIHVWHGALAS